MDPYIIVGSAVVGFLVGMTGAGGGALMTPMLILLFGIKPSTAISSDLVAAVVMRPVGAAVHLRKGTVNLKLVGWMVSGSVPMAFLGSYLLHLLTHAAVIRPTSRRHWAPPCWSGRQRWSFDSYSTNAKATLAEESSTSSPRGLCPPSSSGWSGDS